MNENYVEVFVKILRCVTEKWIKLQWKFEERLWCRKEGKKSLAQEVRQKSDISERRSKGWG